MCNHLNTVLETCMCRSTTLNIWKATNCPPYFILKALLNFFIMNLNCMSVSMFGRQELWKGQKKGNTVNQKKQWRKCFGEFFPAHVSVKMPAQLYYINTKNIYLTLAAASSNSRNCWKLKRSDTKFLMK